MLIVNVQKSASKISKLRFHTGNAGMLPTGIAYTFKRIMMLLIRLKHNLKSVKQTEPMFVQYLYVHDLWKYTPYVIST